MLERIERRRGKAHMRRDDQDLSVSRTCKWNPGMSEGRYQGTSGERWHQAGGEHRQRSGGMAEA